MSILFKTLLYNVIVDYMSYIKLNNYAHNMESCLQSRILQLNEKKTNSICYF